MRKIEQISISAAASMLFLLSGPSIAQAQTFEIGLSPSAKNMASCNAGDSTWAKKWKAEIAGDNATVSGGTQVPLKKASNGLYETTVSFGNSGTFTISLNASERSLKILNKAYGCIWEGKA
jgi:hypothetical protein